MECNHNKILKVLSENNRDDLLKVLIPLVNNVRQSYMLNEIGDFISDTSPLLRSISDKNKIALVSLMKKYYDSTSITFLTDTNVLKQIKNASRDIYSIKAASGIRIATKREVEEGAIGLIKKTEYIIGEEKYKLLHLLGWTITGHLSYYREAGYEYKYSKEYGLEDNIYDMILRASQGIQSMMDWVSSESFDRDMSIIKTQAKDKYVYPEYAPDEIYSSPSVKQLVYYIKCNIQKGSKNERCRKALYLALKNDKQRTPEDISYLREVYTDVVNGRLIENKVEEDSELKEHCQTLLKAKQDGLLNENEFVFKIIGSVEKYGYSKCSEKQYKIIIEALNKLEKAKQKIELENQYDNNMIEEDNEFGSILDMSDKLGSGNFGL